MAKTDKKSKITLENLKKMRECETVQVTFSDGSETECDILCNFDLAGDMLCILFTRGEKTKEERLKTYAVFYDPKIDEIVLDNEMETDELEMIRQVMSANLTRQDEAKTPVCELILDETEEVQFVI